MSWISKLENRWQVSRVQVFLILIVFACTGFTVMFLKEPVLSLFASPEDRTIWFSIVYYILILPVYNIILLFYGTLFGQFRFFWAFEKRMFKRIFRRS